MRLGDLDALKEAIETYDKFACLPDTTLVPFRMLNEPEKNYEPYVCLRDIRNAINNAPTVKTYCYFCGQTEHGIETRPRGKKIKKEAYGWVYCSECDSEVGQQDNFCWNCGADMRGDAENEIS